MHAEFLNHPFSIATWNCSALLGTIASVSRWGELERLCSSHDIVCLQEIHGDAGDEDELHQRFPRHQVAVSFSSSAAMGGIAIIIHPRLLARFPHWTFEIILAGRVLAGRGAGLHGSLAVASVHLFDAGGVSQAQQVQKLHDWISTQAGHASFIGGDLNFIPEDEVRLNLDTGQQTSEALPHGKLFAKLFSDWCELYQPDATRIGVNASGEHVAGRLDRIFCDMNPAELDLRRPRVAVRGFVHLGPKPSDHRPVVCCLAAPRSQAPAPAIPPWVCAHPAFSRIAADLHERGPNMNEFKHVSELAAKNSDILHEASRQVKLLISRTGVTTAHQELHFALKFFHACRARDDFGMRGAAQAAPRLRPFLGLTAPSQDFHDYLGTVTREALAFEKGQLEEDTTIEAETKTRKQQILSKRMAAWSPKQRRIGLEAVTDLEGNPANSFEESAALLVNHWGPIFKAKPANKQWMRWLLNHACEPLSDIIWKLPYDMFLEMARKIPKSAPGPDGIPFRALLTQPAMVEELWAIYSTCVDDCEQGPGYLAPGFNHSLTAFLPKPLPDTAIATSNRAPGSTRPITLSNTYAKMIAKPLAWPLQHLVKKTCLHNQHGMIAGRQITDAVFKVCYAMDSWRRRQGLECGALFLDMQRAFPSVSRVWLRFVLQRAGAPAWFIRMIFLLYTDCATEVSLAGGRYPGFSMEEGVKQGCCLSGALFCLALDPWLRFAVSALPPQISVNAFADDLCFCMQSLLRHLRLLLVLVMVLGRATNLELNLSKCIFVPWWTSDEDEIIRIGAAINAMCPRWQGAKVASFARYLGVLVGPGAEHHQFDAVAAKMRQVTRSLRNLALPFSDAIRAYNTTVAPCASHLLQFVALQPSMLATERWCMQFLARGPWQAMSTALLFQLKQLGFKYEFRNLAALSAGCAARAALRSPVFHTASDEEESWQPHELLAFLHEPHLEAAPLVMHRRLVNQLVDLSVLRPSQSEVSQKTVSKKMLVHLGLDSPTQILDARIRFLLGAAKPAEAGSRCARNFKQAAKLRLPESCRFSALRFVCNGWPTSCRTGLADRRCPWCLEPGAGHALHMLSCHSIAAIWPLAGGRGDLPTLLQSVLGIWLPDDRLKAIFIWLDLLYHCLVAARVGFDATAVRRQCMSRIRIMNFEQFGALCCSRHST